MTRHLRDERRRGPREEQREKSQGDAQANGPGAHPRYKLSQVFHPRTVSCQVLSQVAEFF